MRGLPLGFLPLHQYDRFPRSIRKPKISSCRLYAGHHPSNNQMTLELFMGQICNPIFDVTVHAFDTSSAVRLRSSPNLSPDKIFVLPFPVTLTTLTLNQRSSRRFGNYFWKSSPEGLPPSFLQLRAKFPALVAHHYPACGSAPGGCQERRTLVGQVNRKANHESYRFHHRAYPLLREPVGSN